MTKASSNSKSPFDLVIFDCDGVLVDSEVISCRAHAETLTRHGYPISEQQVLETAMVLLSGPQLLLLDEPSLGLSPKMQAEVFAVARQIAAAGVTVLVVEQNVHGALLVSDTAIVMELGRKFLEGPAAEVRTDPRIREAYLGGNIKETSA